MSPGGGKYLACRRVQRSQRGKTDGILSSAGEVRKLCTEQTPPHLQCECETEESGTTASCSGPNCFHLLSSVKNPPLHL